MWGCGSCGSYPGCVRWRVAGVCHYDRLCLQTWGTFETCPRARRNYSRSFSLEHLSLVATHHLLGNSLGGHFLSKGYHTTTHGIHRLLGRRPMDFFFSCDHDDGLQGTHLTESSTVSRVTKKHFIHPPLHRCSHR